MFAWLAEIYKATCNAFGVDPVHVSSGVVGGSVYAIVMARTYFEWGVAVACGIYAAAWIAPGLYVDLVWRGVLSFDDTVKSFFIGSMALAGTAAVKGVIAFVTAVAGRLANKGGHS